ncbi:hypothetical protein C7821_104354 [Streptomyces sp. VMFN-G11Ma]|nr:hypothetical protein C7821_104354 [Streptomyces sp. VMFN-G11Ma]
MIAVEADPGDAGPLVTGALLAGSLVAGSLTLGALVVSGGGGGGGGGGEAVVVALDVVLDGGAVDSGGGFEVVAEDEGPGPVLGGEDGDVDGGVEGGLDDGFEDEDDDGFEDDDEDDGAGVDLVAEDEGPGGVPDPSDAPPGVPPEAPPEVPPGFSSDVPPDAPPATVSVTYAPNPSAVPAGGSDAVTRASSAGRRFPAYPTARPRPVSRRLASANVDPERWGTTRRFCASKVLSRAPVVPTGRSMPRPGSATSTRVSRAIFRGAGRTDTTDED